MPSIWARLSTSREVDTKLPVVLEVDAYDDRLNQDLNRSNVDPRDNLVYDFEVGFIILNDEVVTVGE